MPYSYTKAGSRRSSQTSGGHDTDKKFGVPRQPWLSGAGVSPSTAADTNASIRSSAGYADEYDPESGEVLTPRPMDYEPECGCNSSAECACPKMSIVDESSLRTFICTILESSVELVDEDEDEEFVDTNEFAAIGGGAGGGASISGYTAPLSKPKKRKKSNKKTTHG